MTNTISGMGEALINKRPLIVLGGASDTTLEGKGAFQEFDQLACAKPVGKWAIRPASIKHVPFVIEKAVRVATYGTPGPVYIDLPADILMGRIEEGELSYLPPVEPLIPLQLQDSQVEAALSLLASAKNPLVIVGKGIAYGDAHKEVREFVAKTNLPFLASPMGKGIISDSDERSVGGARTHSLLHADVIFLCGARLNWIMHFGLPPRFRKDVKIVQLDSDPLEAHNNVKAQVPLIGDAKVILGQLNKAVKGPLISSDSSWWKELKAKKEANSKASLELMQDKSVPMNYYSAIKAIEDQIDASRGDYILVSEGSNTMDIGRTILKNHEPKRRLDAGTWGTMGVGFGFAIAAQSLYPDKKVVMVVGDSAFGFSGMEMETAARYKMPLKVIIINNNGIGSGFDDIEDFQKEKAIPVNALLPQAHYEQISVAFGGKGALVTEHEELKKAVKQMLEDDQMWVLNVMIDPSSSRKAQ